MCQELMVHINKVMKSASNTASIEISLEEARELILQATEEKCREITYSTMCRDVHDEIRQQVNKQVAERECEGHNNSLESCNNLITTTDIARIGNEQELLFKRNITEFEGYEEKNFNVFKVRRSSRTIRQQNLEMTIDTEEVVSPRVAEHKIINEQDGSEI